MFDKKAIYSSIDKNVNKMKINKKLQNAYKRHSKKQSMRDRKLRRYYFDIENLDDDYTEIKKIIIESKVTKFDFCGSCLFNSPPALRVFSDKVTFRFGITKKISISMLKEKLLSDGFIFMEKTKKSGPLCLKNDFSESWETKFFRLFIVPLWDFKIWISNFHFLS